jgi:hypothetical protein
MQDAQTGPRALDDFAGTWRLARRIEDRLGGSAHFTGQAVFTAQPGGLAYLETGTLHRGGQGFAATRCYFWANEGARICVRFEDGRLFHSFRPGPEAQVSHDCAPDRYEGRYDFRTWPEWHVAWEVQGPRKAYRMVSEYTRG